jgi:hypothetical protein
MENARAWCCTDGLSPLERIMDFLLGVTLEITCSIALWEVNMFSNQSFIDLWILQITTIWMLMKLNFFTHPCVYKMALRVKKLGYELGFLMECS